MRHARGRARDDDDAEIDDGAARGDDGQRERRVRASDAMRASERERRGIYTRARDHGRGRAKPRSGRDEGRIFEDGAIGVWDLEVGAKDDD